MQITFSKVASIFFFLSVASADLHDNCACNNGDSYNWRITAKACEVYSSKNYEWGVGVYNETSGRCEKKTDADQIAGDQWEDACKEVATAGFPCADGQGLYCKAPEDEVRGDC